MHSLAQRVVMLTRRLLGTAHLQELDLRFSSLARSTSRRPSAVLNVFEKDSTGKNQLHSPEYFRGPVLVPLSPLPIVYNHL